MKQAIGAYFRALREWKGVSQEYVARQVGVSGKQVYNWERGASLPGGPAIAGLLQALGGSFDDISPYLLMDEDVTSSETEGQELAQRWIAEQMQLHYIN